MDSFVRRAQTLFFSAFKRMPRGGRLFLVRRITPSFHVGSICVVERADGHVLLVRQSYRRGGWGFPGGLLRRGEEPADAARRELSEELAPFLERARAAIRTPLVVGFGISTPTHVAGLVGKADGAIVASAIVDAIERTPPDQLDDAIRALVKEFRASTAGTVPA